MSVVLSWEMKWPETRSNPSQSVSQLRENAELAYGYIVPLRESVSMAIGSTLFNQTTSEFVARACRRTYSAGGSPNGRTREC